MTPAHGGPESHSSVAAKKSFFCVANFCLSAAVGLCALTAIIRLFRGQKQIGNFFVDMWRVVVYIFLRVAFVISLVFFAVMLVMFVGTIVWAIYFDTLKPNPGLTAHPTARSYEIASATASGGKLPISLPDEVISFPNARSTRAPE